MAAAANGATKGSELDGQEPESTDFANYFCTYAYLYHQKDMLEDHKRTGKYYQACMQNKKQFKDKVVLDVGTGSGILAIFAAKAGAKKVYAVEATNMAVHARKLVAHNKLDDVVTVIQGTIESVNLPEKVDIIISEWMGYFLLRESMLDSVIVARDKFMKPGGAMYPSHARMYLAPIQTNLKHQRMHDFQSSMEGWSGFIKDMRSCYGVDLDCLSSNFKDEQRDYFLATSQWADIHPSQQLGPCSCFKTYDLHTLTLEELQAPMKEKFALEIVDHAPVEAFCGWFDVDFAGSEENPADVVERLSTAPDPTGATHWGQHCFYVHPSIECSPGDRVEGTISVERQKVNHRLLEVCLDLAVTGSGPTTGSSRTLKYHIE